MMATMTITMTMTIAMVMIMIMTMVMIFLPGFGQRAIQPACYCAFQISFRRGDAEYVFLLQTFPQALAHAAADQYIDPVQRVRPSGVAFVKTLLDR